MNKNYTEQKFVICHNNEGIIHYTGISTGESISTGLPYYEEYDNEEEWKSRLVGLGITFFMENINDNQ